MPWAGNIAKTMTSNEKQFTVTRKMLTAVARDQRWPDVVAVISARFSKFAFALFCYITNHLMTGPLGNGEFCWSWYLNFIWSLTYLILFFLIDLCTKVTSDCKQFCFMSTFLLSIVFSAVFHNQSPWCACWNINNLFLFFFLEMCYFIINLGTDYFTQAGLIWSAGQLHQDLACLWNW